MPSRKGEYTHRESSTDAPIKRDRTLFIVRLTGAPFTKRLSATESAQLQANVAGVRFYECCKYRQTRSRRLPTTSTKGYANSLSQSLFLSPIMGSSLWILFVKLLMYCVMCRCTGPRQLVRNLRTVRSHITDEFYSNWTNMLT